MTNNELSRRDFIKTAAIASSAIGSMASINVNAEEKGSGKTLKVALIGAGGRGHGAIRQNIEAGKQLGVNIKPVAFADWFEGKAKRGFHDYGVPEDKCFWGGNAYKKVMETDADIILLATPPAFRPAHFAAAIEAGKHVFTEKPVGVDPHGVRQILAAGKKAQEKGLSVVAGTQRRHRKSYLEAAHLIHEGAIGKIMNGQIFWCGGVPWIRKRNDGQSDIDYMISNWLNWSMISGDHIVEQHVHNIDVANWFIRGIPKSVLGFGGRSRRTTGDCYDFFSLDLDYGDGCHIHSMCRQNKGCYSRVGEQFAGTEGEYSGRVKSNKKVDIKVPEFRDGNEYVIEHYDLIKSIIDGKPLNEAENVANATMVAVMGRMSAFTGQIIRWSDVTSNKDSKFYNMRTKPFAIDFETGNVVAPPDDVIQLPPA